MFIPKTSDGRVLFCIPWHGVLEIGTTDKEEKDISFNPEPTEEEIEFMLETACKYRGYPLSRKDVLASFAGTSSLVLTESSRRLDRSRVQRALGYS